MIKTMTVLMVAAALLIITSIASMLVEPVQASKARKVNAGGAYLLVPLNLPVEVMNGTIKAGSVQFGSKDVCDITYDSFTGIYWSERVVAVPEILPTPAYVTESEQPGTVEVEPGRQVKTRTIKLSAEKPCGKIVKETLNVIDMYCAGSKTHYSIVGMEDPFMTKQRMLEIARSMKCS